MMYPKNPEEGQVIDLPITLMFLRIFEGDSHIGDIQSLSQSREYDTKKLTLETTLECSGVRTKRQLGFGTVYEVRSQEFTNPQQKYSDFFWHPFGGIVCTSTRGIGLFYVEEMRVISFSDPVCFYSRVVFKDKLPGEGRLIEPIEVGVKHG
jgi:hypothetical protein